MTKPASPGLPPGEAEGVELRQRLPPTRSPAARPAAAGGSEPAGTAAGEPHTAARAASAWALCETNGSRTAGFK